MPNSNLRQALLITTFLAGAYGSPAVAQEPRTCSNFQTSAFGIEAPSFNEESAFDLQIRQEADGYHLRITGDNVILSEATASSLIADSANAKTGLKSLTIDARRLRLESPLSFVDANIRIIGDEIVVAGDAQINLLPSGSGQPRSLSIVANTLKFENSRRRPFDLQFTQGSGAIVEFVLLTALSNSTPIDSADAIWRRFTDSVEIETAPSGFSSTIGEGATETVAQTFNQEMEWPLFYASKVKRTFSRAPFLRDEDGIKHSELVEIIDAYVDSLAEWRDPYPLLTVQTVLSAIDNDVDFQGRSSSFVPKQDAWSQATNIEELANKEVFDRLINIIVATASKKDQAEKAVTALRQQLTLARDEQRQIERRMADANIRLQVLAQSIQRLDTLIGQRTETLAEMSRREFERLKDAQSVQQWTTVAAAAVVVAASFGAATPAVAGAAAAGLSLTGDQIYRHNVGEPFRLPDLLATGAKTYQAIGAFQSSWQSFLAAQDVAKQVVYDGQTVLEGDPPKEGEPDNRKPISKFTATKNLVASLADLVGKADGLSSGQPPGPTPISLTDRENEDEVMKGYLAERASANGEINSLSAQLQSDVRLLEGLEATIADISINISELLQVDPINDQQNARWNSNAYEVWQLEVRSIAERVELLKKSVLFETGRPLTGPLDVLEYPNELIANIDAGIFDPTAGIGKDYSAELRGRLELERDKFLSSVQTVVRSARRELQDYLDTRTEADTYRRTFTLSLDSIDPIERAFMETLNGQIAQQIVSGVGTEEVDPAYIPITLTSLPSPVPERVTDVKVVSASFSVPSSAIGNNAISFSVVHPGYGEMRRRSGCAIGDFRSRPDDWRFFTTFFEQIDPVWSREEPRALELSTETRGRYYAFLPAQTMYHMVVGVHSKNWRRIPRLTNITVGFEIME
ncbi:hypothetical protein EYE42_14495 [Paracoccus subflavus]|uniref:Uncharacterized protein n=1 Tax=Paracoccus subflavus TaxID=2528244 RepID=A0A4V2JBU2_9RHOB|nr:hypothetical protein [Paracoccus subflavus]TBN37236.1 hypothetical protein EYE42_14495 [Paracoccus subflavus]